jgi:hypothetical protein
MRRVEPGAERLDALLHSGMDVLRTPQVGSERPSLRSHERRRRSFSKSTEMSMGLMKSALETQTQLPAYDPLARPSLLRAQQEFESQ